MPPAAHASHNHLLRMLPSAERDALVHASTWVTLETSQVLWRRGELMEYAYFPVSGFISSMAGVDRELGVEVGMVGHEGMVGAPLVLGVALAPLHAVVRGAGQALRLEAQALHLLLRPGNALHTMLQRYLYVLLQQLANSAVCVRFHHIDHRLARWLLMSQDRIQSDRFAMTHEFLAYLLGVRRVGITNAAGLLQDASVIRYHRGNIQVLNRLGLEAASCNCYGEDQKIFHDLLGLILPSKSLRPHHASLNTS